jgi:hypothetical protein
MKLIYSISLFNLCLKFCFNLFITFVYKYFSELKLDSVESSISYFLTFVSRINKDKFGFISYTFKSQLTYFGGSYYSLRIGVNLSNISFDKTTTLDGLRLIIHNKTFDPNYYWGISHNGFNLASKSRYISH